MQGDRTKTGAVGVRREYRIDFRAQRGIARAGLIDIARTGGRIARPRRMEHRRHLLLGLDRLGTVAAGKSADFIVLDTNPLEDIHNTRRINAVYLRGQAVDRAVLRAKWTGARTTE